MKISEHTLTEAKKILKEQKPLPQQITSAPHFYIAKASDETIQAFTSVEYEGVKYKIGTHKG